MLKEKSTSWSNLHLNLLGRINLVKIMLLPKCNFIFRNCPLWVPRSFFLIIECCVSSFLLEWHYPTLSLLSTLSLPTRLGGLAFPNFQVYFWAAMLVLVYWWFQGSRANLATCLEASFLGSLSDPRNFAYRGQKAYNSVPSPTYPTWRVWRTAT